jgi:hypothetical protein
MKKIIFSNNDYDIDDKERIESIAECREIPIEEVTEDMIWNRISTDEELWFQDELDNLNKQLDGRVIAIVDLGLWTGRHSGYKIGTTNLNEVIMMGNYDYIAIYSDGYNIRKDSSHHDGTNHMLFRMIREDRNIDNLLSKIYNNEHVSNSMLNYYTKSLVKDVNDIFGW